MTRGGRRPAATSVVAGRRAVAEAIRAGAAVEVLLARGTRETPGLRAVTGAAADAGIDIRRVDRRELDLLASQHQGVVARLGREGPAKPPLTERDLARRTFEDDAVAVVLDGIMDPQNLGACARSCEAAGVAVLVTRTRRAAGATPAAVRASAGALQHLPHARVPNLARAIASLQASGFWAIGLDASAEATVYDEPCPGGPIALVVGGEGMGLSRLVRERCDVLVRLPMTGRVGSLNASASLAAALWGFVVPSRLADRPGVTRP